MKYILIILSAFIFMSCDVMYMDNKEPYTISQENKALLNEIFDNKVNLDNVYVCDIKTEWWGFYLSTDDSIYIDREIIKQENLIKQVLMHEFIHKYEFHTKGYSKEDNSYKFMYVILDWNREAGSERNGYSCLNMRQEWEDYIK